MPVELIWSNPRPPLQIICRNDLLFEEEIQRIDGLPVTTPDRTAFDLGRRGQLGAAVACLDALSGATGFKADDVLLLAERHRRARGLRQLEAALDLFDPGGQSPQETRLRLMLIDEGYPRPQTQIPVLGPDGYPKYYLDMGWEDIMLAVEYDGVQHADQLGYDIVRHEYITDVGWTTVRVAAGHRRPGILRRVYREWNRLRSPLTVR
ncbi:DUF559 domain-containing protein [Mycobacterium sp. 21AC1]|uniref:DUF559 domain-containing protein n=1 Tax=[Mycobacterium] appelbergii TaxID=2939269 RepID=UPI0029393CBB|nr:DUF559 domain-containing protein [Mycobacterium sp. 21AC1]MDV3124187.1 DUF559 domain-containing protein [Mycobacterium sp. 21AC1]